MTESVAGFTARRTADAACGSARASFIAAGAARHYLSSVIPGLGCTAATQTSRKLAQTFGGLQVDGDQGGDALFGHGDAEEAVHTGHGDRVVGDDDEAGFG